MQDLGADEVVDYGADLEAAVRALHPDGVDAAIHLAGDPMVLAGLVRKGGRIVSTLGVGPEQVAGLGIEAKPVMTIPSPELLGGLAAAVAAARTAGARSRRPTSSRKSAARCKTSGPGHSASSQSAWATAEQRVVTTSGKLEGKVAIVTGAGSVGEGYGTGKAMAVLFAREGAKVVLVDRDKDRVNETRSIIESEGGTASVVLADLLERRRWLADCGRSRGAIWLRRDPCQQRGSCGAHQHSRDRCRPTQRHHRRKPGHAVPPLQGGHSRHAEGLEAVPSCSSRRSPVFGARAGTAARLTQRPSRRCTA